jgi:hypothetical protein
MLGPVPPLEVVRLDGRRDGLTEEELERFVKRFPVQTT